MRANRDVGRDEAGLGAGLDARLDRNLEEHLARLMGGAPADGFEQRMALGVRAKLGRSRTPRRFLVPVGLAFAAGCALVAAIAVGHRRPEPQGQRVAVVRRVPGTAQARAVAVTSEGENHVPFAGRPRAGEQARGGAASAVATQPVVLREVSFPAPAAPLTAQERMLLRLAHRGDREEIAALSPAEREREQRDELAEYQDFFRPPPEVPQPGDSPDADVNATPAPKGDTR